MKKSLTEKYQRQGYTFLKDRTTRELNNLLSDLKELCTEAGVYYRVDTKNNFNFVFKLPATKWQNTPNGPKVHKAYFGTLASEASYNHPGNGPTPTDNWEKVIKQVEAQVAKLTS